MFAASKVAGAAAAGSANYIEDVFSTYLYTGNGSTQTITNNIDLANSGGLTWIKSRSSASTNHTLTDTARGTNSQLYTSATSAANNNVNEVTAFNTTGFSLGASTVGQVNKSAQLYASWTFRKQPKFFDCGTFTTTGSSNQRVPHSLGSTPGFIIIKSTDVVDAWYCYHRDLGIGKFISLNTTTGAVTLANTWGTSAPTSTDFGVNTASAFATGSYVYYAFAHDAGGFGLTGTDNVISCGSMTTDGSALASVTLGYEPQFLLTKRTDGAGNWHIVDNMRGFVSGTAGAGASDDYLLYPNLTTIETLDHIASPKATGFDFVDPTTATGTTFIYIAIRRGPMKTPTSGTSVFQPVAYTGTNVDNRLVNTGIVTDMTMARIRTASSTGGFYTADRLRGNYFLGTAVSDAEATDADSYMTPTSGYGNSFSAMNGFGVGNDVTRQLNQSSTSQLAYAFRRAPGFFDEVCYSGNGSTQNISHNLGVAPEMMIVKIRSTTTSWHVYHSGLTDPPNAHILLNSTAAQNTTSSDWNSTAPTSSVFSVGSTSATNSVTGTYVAYLFATLAGVSKVGSFTQSAGVNNAVDCGFTAGARYVLIKSKTATSNDDWYVWDSARGIISGNDPYLRYNLSNVEVTASDSLIPNAAGFTTNGGWWSAGNYIYLAIA